MKLSLNVRYAALLAVLVFANLPRDAFTQSACPGIHVKILNMRDSAGTMDCALFESPDGFPAEFLHSATNVMIIKIRKSQARCDFEDIPPGTYAMVVIHDENMNGKLDANWMGIPTEEATVFRTMQEAWSARRPFPPPASRTTGGTLI